MIVKLASATPSASQPAGNADSDTTIVGSGMIETAPIAVKWWLQIASVSSTRPDSLPFHRRVAQPGWQRERADSSPPSTMEAPPRTGSH